jgi:hypothetical protein
MGFDDLERLVLDVEFLARDVEFLTRLDRLVLSLLR